MARRYNVDASAPVGADKSIGLVYQDDASPLTRPRIYEVVLGCAATPADQATSFLFQRTTTAGTATAFTPFPHDPSESAAQFAAKEGAGSAFSGEPTYTSAAILKRIPLHQRNTFRWICDEEKGFVIPATQNHGIGLLSKTATGTAVHQASISVWE